RTRVRRVRRKQADPAAFHALQPLDGAVNLKDPVRVEPGLLEVVIDVGSKDERSVTHPPRPCAEEDETVVRTCGAIQAQAMAVEAPSEPRVLIKPARVGHFAELPSQLFVNRVGPPESDCSAEIGQS